MKFDEKVVSYYESCNSPVDKEGYLQKKGEFNTSYQKRWCVLKGNLLFYKDRPADRDVIGVIVLEGCTVQLCESEEQFAFSLVWSEPGLRTYKFAAEDQVSQESWIKALLSANHGYLALLVMDMERKYREALSEYSIDPVNSFTTPNFSTAGGGGRPTAGSFISHVSTLPSFSASAVGSGPNLSQNPMLQPPPPTSTKSASRRSPKLWPKRSTNVVPANSLPAPLGEWSGVTSGSMEDFSKMHEDFGKEVKELIANWAKKGHGDVAEGNLIDFG